MAGDRGYTDASAAVPQSIAGLARALQARETRSRDITERCLQAIAENRSLNAFIAVLADEALAQADAADREMAAGRYRGPLHGVPISIKDLIDLQGTPTTAASRVRGAARAPADATAIRRLRDAGAVFVGKCNLHEFAFGTTNEESAFGPARHPLDPSRSPGGSSGGSAVSVATGMAFASIGTDTGGSVRIPAAACGLVGLKPGLGEIPTDGVVPLSRTMDHVGPLCRCVRDANILYDVLRGAPPSAAPPTDQAQLRLGIPRDYFLAVLDPQVAATFEGACERIRSAGVTLTEVSIPHANDIAPVYLHIVLAEAAAYHAKTLDSRGDDYTPTVRARLEMGRYILAEDYVRALRGRDVLMREVDAALRNVNALLLPALAIPAPKLGAATVKVGGSEEPIRNITLRLTQLFNVTGHPAIAMPCGRTIDRLPVSAQLVAGAGKTHELLRIAQALESYLTPGGSC